MLDWALIMQNMRDELNDIFGEDLRVLSIQTRDRLDITQLVMGEKLYMSESSYSDIETGRSHCSMTTAILLLEMQDDPKSFLKNTVKKAKAKVQEEEEKGLQEGKDLQPV